jgi:Cytochrome P460
MVIVSAVTVVVSVALAAQDRYTLKSPNGIAFAEFKGYDARQVIATSQPVEEDGCGTSKVGCMKVILGNATMIKAYNDGIPANGKPVPDGAAMAKVQWFKTRNNASPYDVTVPGAQTEVGFMVKDPKRFPDADGWGYATF